MRPVTRSLRRPVAALLVTLVACSAHRPATEPAAANAGAKGSQTTGASAVSSSSALPKIPGVDVEKLTPETRGALQAILADEFCSCGCPHTLGACLREHKGCRHAPKMAKLALNQLDIGLTAEETIVLMARYDAGFREERVSLTVDPAMCTGKADAAVTLVEFSDFECPYCAASRPVLEAFAKKHTDNVRFCFAPYPLPGHPNAIPATQAALAARASGKFWEMHDALFERQRELSPDVIRDIGTKLGIGAAVAQALRPGQFSAEIEKWKSQGNAAHISATPTVFVNGRPLSLPIDAANLERVLEDELEWKAHNGWAPDEGG